MPKRVKSTRRKSRKLTKPLLGRQVKHREKREPRDVIISFRLRQSEADALRRDMDANPSAGVKSLQQFSRKLIIDYARGRTVYVDPLDRKIDPYSRDSIDRLLPNCVMSDPHFIRSLAAFLNVVENWRKLRFFMLLAGWPKALVDLYNDPSSSDQERLMAAQEFLKSMLKS